jgi:hypothetical protein
MTCCLHYYGSNAILHNQIGQELIDLRCEETTSKDEPPWQEGAGTQTKAKHSAICECSPTN